MVGGNVQLYPEDEDVFTHVAGAFEHYEDDDYGQYDDPIYSEMLRKKKKKGQGLIIAIGLICLAIGLVLGFFWGKKKGMNAQGGRL